MTLNQNLLGWRAERDGRSVGQSRNKNDLVKLKGRRGREVEKRRALALIRSGASACSSVQGRACPSVVARMLGCDLGLSHGGVHITLN